jgi:hypothetical protein
MNLSIPGLAVNQDFLAGAVSGFFSMPHPAGISVPPSLAAALPAVEQQAISPLPSLEQHEDLPSFIVEQPSLPQQPSLPLQAMPAAEHLHPSLVPPVLSVGVALAFTIPSSFVVDEVVLPVLDVLPFRVAFELFVLPPVLLQPARPSNTTARSATSLIFIDSLLFQSPEVVRPFSNFEGG